MDPHSKKLKTLSNGTAVSDANEKELISVGLGSKSKACTKFFSTSGCPYGEDCHYLHYVPGGVTAVSQLSKLSNTLGLSREAIGFTSSFSLSDKSGPVTGYKTCLCNHYASAEGCQFGDKCHYAHGEKELRKENVLPNELLPSGVGTAITNFGTATTNFGAGSKANPGYKTCLCNNFSSSEGCKYGDKCHFAHGEKELRKESALPNGATAAANFGASSKANISIVAAYAGGVIGKDGVNSKHIYRATGVKLTIKDHESDPNLKTIEFEGSFDKINQATAMVRELILKIGSLLGKQSGNSQQSHKTRLCEHFAKGSCTFGDKCHFAHGASELRDDSASIAPSFM
ncbi:hypothetical protein SUGI_0128980 [Cryptomeria japonica]|nr:hypothetical protein SUGI_0128980 [Cryptomeria japonica]